MGVTIHYHIKAAQNIDAAEAQRLIKRGRNIAGRMLLRSAVDRVGPLMKAEKTGSNAVLFRDVPVPGRPRAFVPLEVRPDDGFMFRVDVGSDCEPLWLGLCRYPAETLGPLGMVKTRLGSQWRFDSFSKTQYASLHGWDHFFRCHRAIIDLLAAWRDLGLTVRISDEGDYWPRRSERALRRNIDYMNRAIAAAAGAIKDQCGDGVVAPIFRHPNFERLEADGVAAIGNPVQKA